LGEWDKAHATVADLKWSVMVDSPAVNALFARTVAAHARRPLGLVVVDYLQLMDASDARRDDNRAYELGEITRALKKLAQRLKVPVLVASQLTRPKGDRRPGLRDMADSSSIEKNSDQVIIIHDRSTLEVAKSRMGPLGEFPVEWVGERAMFRAPLFERKAALAAVPPI
jgi:replicative DNA helicase